MRNRMMRFGEAECGIGPLAYLSRHHEGENPCQVRLPGDREQIEHQRHVLFVRLRYTDRLRWHVCLDLRLCHGLLNAPFNLPHVIEIFVESSPVAGTEPRLEVLKVADDEIENAPVGRSCVPTAPRLCCRRRTSAQT